MKRVELYLNHDLFLPSVFFSLEILYIYLFIYNLQNYINYNNIFYLIRYNNNNHLLSLSLHLLRLLHFLFSLTYIDSRVGGSNRDSNSHLGFPSPFRSRETSTNPVRDSNHMTITDQTKLSTVKHFNCINNFQNYFENL